MYACLTVHLIFTEISTGLISDVSYNDSEVLQGNKVYIETTGIRDQNVD